MNWFLLLCIFVLAYFSNGTDVTGGCTQRNRRSWNGCHLLTGSSTAADCNNVTIGGYKVQQNREEINPSRPFSCTSCRERKSTILDEIPTGFANAVTTTAERQNKGSMAANYSPIVAFGTSPPAIRMSSEFSYPTYQDNARQTFPSSSLSTTGTIDVRKESLVYTSSGSYPSKEIPSETIITTNHYGIKVTRAPSTSARTISTVGETDALPAATSDPLGSTDVTKPTTRTLSTSEGVVTPPTSEDPSGSSGITKPATRTLSTSEGAVTQSITKDPSGSTGIAEPTTRTLSTSEEAVTQSVRKDPSRYTGTAKPVIRTLSTSEEAVTQYITKDPSGSTDTAKPATLSSLGTKLTNSSTSDPQGSHSSTVLHNDSFTTLSSLISESTSAPDDGSLVTTSQPDTTLVTTSQPDTTLVTTSQPDTTLVTTSQPDTTLVTTSQPDTTLVTTSQPDTTLVTTSQPDTTLVTTSQPDTTLVTTSQPVTTLVTTSQPVTTLVADTITVPSYRSTTGIECRTFFTAEDGLSYEMFRASPFDGFIEFQVKAQRDVHIILTPSLTSADIYEIIIDSIDDTRSGISRCLTCDNVVTSPDQQLLYLNENEFRHFWISLTSSGTISVGKDGESQPFLQWTDPSPLQVNYIGYYANGIVGGEFKFCDLGNLLPQCPENLKNYYCSCTISGGHTISYQNGYVDSVHSCSCEGIDNARRCLWLPSDCQELRNKGIDVDGLYSIFPSWKGMLPMDVMCNMLLKGGGWTMIQRRVNGSVDFNRDKLSYDNGFGIRSHEFWIGNSQLYALLKPTNYTLRIDMVLPGGSPAYAEYDSFRIEDKQSDFRISSLGKFSRSSTYVFDAMARHLGMSFTTYDYDVDDQKSSNCATIGGGGWWYNGGAPDGWCWHANLNGQFNQFNDKAIIWYFGQSAAYKDILEYVDMKIRPTIS
ncbi:uncharacterized protein [Apostichopus japonicus]|uniref:uncharacterized protein isoform X2 n=1 Tax=Stichopus japonicus TaxID=307972 RepID=UPI003AB450FF